MKEQQPRRISPDDLNLLAGDSADLFADRLLEYVQKEGTSVVAPFGFGGEDSELIPQITADPSTTKEEFLKQIRAK